MDQLRTILAWLKKQHFWVLSVLVALVGLFCWWTATGKTSKKFDANKSRITGEFSSVQQVSSDPFHPNQTINDKQEEERQKQAKEVFAVWQKLYDRQTEQVLEWPESLTQEFRDYVEKLEFGQEIPEDLRSNYRDYADRYFPSLPKIVNARPLREGEGVGLGGGGGDFMRSRRSFEGPAVGFQAGGQGQVEEDDDNYTCEWLDQHVVRAELDFPERPYSMKIWVTQEDLWVYKALLLSIKNVNEAAGATRISNAPIRTIASLEIGKRAAPSSRTPDRIYKVPTAAPVAADPTEMAIEPGAERGDMLEQAMPRMDYGSGQRGDGTMSEAEEKNMLLSYRYLDDQGKPIPVGSTGMSGDEGMPSDPAMAAAPVDTSIFGKEYKRLPVRMVLEMDARHLPQLIAQCASQSLQIEVQEVRINPPDGVGGSSGGGIEGFRSSLRGGYGGGGFGGGGSSTNLFPERTGLLEFSPQPHLATVIIQGIVYIFNKPDPSIVEATDDGQMASN